MSVYALYLDWVCPSFTGSLTGWDLRTPLTDSSHGFIALIAVTTVLSCGGSLLMRPMKRQVLEVFASLRACVQHRRTKPRNHSRFDRQVSWSGLAAKPIILLFWQLHRRSTTFSITAVQHLFSFLSFTFSVSQCSPASHLAPSDVWLHKDQRSHRGCQHGSACLTHTVSNNYPHTKHWAQMSSHLIGPVLFDQMPFRARQNAENHFLEFLCMAAKPSFSDKCNTTQGDWLKEQDTERQRVQCVLKVRGKKRWKSRNGLKEGEGSKSKMLEMKAKDEECCSRTENIECTAYL